MIHIFHHDSPREAHPSPEGCRALARCGAELAEMCQPDPCPWPKILAPWAAKNDEKAMKNVKKKGCRRCAQDDLESFISGQEVQEPERELPRSTQSLTAGSLKFSGRCSEVSSVLEPF